MWAVERVRAEFEEDVLRDVCRDVNDLMCGRAGYGHHPNRVGIPEDIWRILLRAGGYKESGVAKIFAGELPYQEDTEAAFTPYTIHTLVNVLDSNGGPITDEQLDQVIGCALRYRQLIEA